MLKLFYPVTMESSPNNNVISLAPVHSQETPIIQTPMTI